MAPRHLGAQEREVLAPGADLVGGQRGGQRGGGAEEDQDGQQDLHCGLDGMRPPAVGIEFCYISSMPSKVLVLGAGFAGLELCSALSEALGDSIQVTLIDQSDAFIFGYSKLDVMFGRETPAAV